MYVSMYLVNLSNRKFSFVNVFYRVSPNNTKLVFLDTYVDCIITCKWDKSLIQTRNTTELSLSQPKVYFPISTIRQSKAGFERQMSSFFFCKWILVRHWLFCSEHVNSCLGPSKNNLKRTLIQLATQLLSTSQLIKAAIASNIYKMRIKMPAVKIAQGKNTEGQKIHELSTQVCHFFYNLSH